MKNKGGWVIYAQSAKQGIAPIFQGSSFFFSQSIEVIILRFLISQQEKNMGMII